MEKIFKMKKLVFFIVFGCLLAVSYRALSLTKVKIAAVAPLDASDTEYSERYRIGYQGALFFSAGKQAKRLKMCGYSIEFDFNYYEEHDKSTAYKIGKKLEKNRTWLVLGPSRSSHFLVLNKGLNTVPHVSALANSSEVMELEHPSYTMYPSTRTLSKSILSVTKSEDLAGKYGVIVDKGCVYCRDFQNVFAEVAGSPKFLIDFNPDAPNFKEIESQIQSSGLNFILLPNYSKASGALISNLANRFKDIVFLGGDGWGDGTYGYLTKIDLPKTARGYSVRLGGTPERMISTLGLESLSFMWRNESFFPTSSALIQSEVIEIVSDLLCKFRPKDSETFGRVVKENGKNLFKSQLPITVFSLKNGKLRYHSDAKKF